MKYLSKEEIVTRFKDKKVRVFYKGKKRYIEYGNTKHINWKNVVKITIIFDKSKVYTYNGEQVTRDGVSYLLRDV